MKVLLFGNPMNGFDKTNGTTDISALTDWASTEAVVLVCHGAPLALTESRTAFRISPPELLSLNLHTLLLAQTGDAAVEAQVRMLKDLLSGKCARVFGLNVGWNNLSENDRERLSGFLTSNEAVPSDRLVQRLLGFDLPVMRL